MTSPYLDHSRPTRKIVEELIRTREVALTRRPPRPRSGGTSKGTRVQACFFARSWLGSTVRG